MGQGVSLALAANDKQVVYATGDQIMNQPAKRCLDSFFVLGKRRNHRRHNGKRL